jgi:hypothetical protein
MESGMNFGLWVQLELMKHEKSLSWLAGRIGSHPSLLCKWRAGLSNPKTEYFFLVCKEISLLRKEPIEDTIREGAKAMGIKF